MTTGNTELEYLNYCRIREKVKDIEKQPSCFSFKIFSSEAVVVPANASADVRTGLKFKIPRGFFGRFCPYKELNRADLDASGYHRKQDLKELKIKDVYPLDDAIDSDYTDEIVVTLYNLGNSDATIEKHDPIAVLVMEKTTNRRISLRGSLETEPGPQKFCLRQEKMLFGDRCVYYRIKSDFAGELHGSRVLVAPKAYFPGKWSIKDVMFDFYYHSALDGIHPSVQIYNKRAKWAQLNNPIAFLIETETIRFESTEKTESELFPKETEPLE